MANPLQAKTAKFVAEVVRLQAEDFYSPEIAKTVTTQMKENPGIGRVVSSCLLDMATNPEELWSSETRNVAALLRRQGA